MDNLLIGKYIGPFELGLYSKAYSLLLMPISQINTPFTHVAIPALSRLQNDPAHYRRFYLRAMSSIVYLTMPLVIVMGTLSDEIIMILLGEKWLGASPIFRVLAFSALIQPAKNLTGWIFISLGQTNKMMNLSFFTNSLYVLSFSIGLKWGAIGVATCYTIAQYLTFIPILWITYRGTPVNLSDALFVMWKPCVISATLFLVLSISKLMFVDITLLARTTLSMAVGLFSVLFLIFLWPAAKSDLYSIFDIIRKEIYVH